LKFQPLVESVISVSGFGFRRGFWRVKAIATPGIVERRKISRTATLGLCNFIVLKATMGERMEKSFERHFWVVSIQISKLDMSEIPRRVTCR
jgi:hypothetical protein